MDEASYDMRLNLLRATISIESMHVLLLVTIYQHVPLLVLSLCMCYY